MVVRPARPADADAWHRMRTALYSIPGRPEENPTRDEVEHYFADPPDWTCLMVFDHQARPIGFCEVGARTYAEGCTTSPVGYVEGIWVEPAARRARVGRALAAAAEAWTRRRGLREIASDCALDNEVSRAFHIALGFAEVERIICFRKALDEAE